MRKIILLTILCISFQVTRAQKIDSIFFNLYTDSLKKGFYNYINIEGKLSNGTWVPLTASDLILKSDAGQFDGNEIFIDSSFKGDRIKVTAELKINPAVKKEIFIYIRKRGFDEILKTDEEILDELKAKRPKPKMQST